MIDIVIVLAAAAAIVASLWSIFRHDAPEVPDVTRARLIADELRARNVQVIVVRPAWLITYLDPQSNLQRITVSEDQKKYAFEVGEVAAFAIQQQQNGGAQ